MRDFITKTNAVPKDEVILQRQISQHFGRGMGKVNSTLLTHDMKQSFLKK